MSDNGDLQREDSPSAPSRERQADGDARGTDEWLAPFITDSSLWPVLLVVASCLSTLGAAVLVAGLYHQNLAAAAALLGLAWISFDVGKRRRRANGRLGILGWSILSLWALSATIGGIAIGLGLA